MNGAQIAMTVLLGMDLGYALANHGEVKEEKQSIWTTMITNAIIIFILYKGGFWV